VLPNQALVQNKMFHPETKKLPSLPIQTLTHDHCDGSCQESKAPNIGSSFWSIALALIVVFEKPGEEEPCNP